MKVPDELKYYVAVLSIYQAEFKQEEDEAIGAAIKSISEADREVIKYFIDNSVKKYSDLEILAVWNACRPTYHYEPTSYLRILLAKISSQILAFTG